MSVNQQIKIWGLLHEKLLFFLELDNRLAGESNRLGISDTPLHCLCRIIYHMEGSSPPLEIFQLLVNANTQALTIRGVPHPLKTLIQTRNPILLQRVFDFFLSALDSVQQSPSLYHVCEWIPFTKIPNDGLRMLKLVVARSLDSLHTFDVLGKLPLHYACQNQDITIEALQHLIEQYPQAVKEGDRRGAFALHYASGRSIEVVKFIYELFPEAVKTQINRGDDRHFHGLDWLKKSKHSYPIHCALAHNQGKNVDAVVKFLYDQYPGAASDESRKFLIHFACRNPACDIDLLTFLETLTSGNPYSCLDQDGRMPLHLLLSNARGSNQNPSIELVKYVVEKAPDAVKHRDNDGRLPLQEFFSVSGSLSQLTDESVFFYLVDLCPEQVKNVLHCHVGIHKPSLSLLKRLIEKIPSILHQTVGKSGRLPVHEAFENETLSPDIVKCLADADPLSLYARDKNGIQPIHLACGIGNSAFFFGWEINETKFEVYRKREGPLLLGILANLEITNIGGVVEFMLRNFPRLSLVGGNEHGETAFHFAAARVFQPELIRGLAELDHSALGVKDENGNLPLHIASTNCNLAAIEYLLKTRGERDLQVPNKQNMYPLFLVCQDPSTRNANYNSARHLDVIWRMTKAFPDLFSSK